MGGLTKFAPIGIVAGVMGYLCWPYFDEPSKRSESAGLDQVIQVTAALLSPSVAPALKRDPFKSAKSNGPVASTSPRSTANKPGTAAKAVAAPIAGPPITLVLNGTYVRGNQRIAVINGTVYAQGEQISVEHASVENCSVARVDVDKVVLNFNGATAELRYANTIAPESPIASHPTAPPRGVKTLPPPIRTSANHAETRGGSPAEGKTRQPPPASTKSSDDEPTAPTALPTSAVIAVPNNTH